MIDARRGEYRTALEHLDEALARGSRNGRALNLKSAIHRAMGDCAAAETIARRQVLRDPLDLWARVELGYFEDNADEIRAMRCCKL